MNTTGNWSKFCIWENLHALTLSNYIMKGPHLKELTNRNHGIFLVLSADEGSGQFVALSVHQLVVSVLAHLQNTVIVPDCTDWNHFPMYYEYNRLLSRQRVMDWRGVAGGRREGGRGVGGAGGRERERAHTQRQNSNLKTLILKDSSIRSSGTYLTANPC